MLGSSNQRVNARIFLGMFLDIFFLEIVLLRGTLRQ
jgi:hypothetical protein